MFIRTGHAVPACGAFITLCDLLDLFTSCARGVVTPLMMRRRVHLFLDAFVAAFGVQSMIPKCHWLLHFARHLERWGNLLACFVTERKHKMLKRYANDLDNTSHFERSLMAEVVCHQIQALDDPNTFSIAIGLVKPQKAPRKLADVLMAEFQVEYEFVATATTSRFSKFATCSKKDVVLFTRESLLSLGRFGRMLTYMVLQSALYRSGHCCNMLQPQCRPHRLSSKTQCTSRHLISLQPVFGLE